MHLILEECQPVSRCASFHKRRSLVRKSEKDAICSHLIQAPDNVLRKLKFHCLNFPYFCVAKFHMSYRSSKRSLSQGFIEGFFEIQIFPLQGKYVCGLFGERSVRIMGGQK